MKRTLSQAAKKIARNKAGFILDNSIFEESKRNVDMRGLNPDKEWIPINRALPKGSVLIKTTSGLVMIGDLYEGKWRVDGHWKRVDGEWMSDYKFEDIAYWRNIPI